MNPATSKDAKRLFAATKKAGEKAKQVSLVVAPPSLYLRELSQGYRGRIAFAVQNAFYELVGSRTGEISYVQAADSRATYAIVGHAERRTLGETNDDARLKVAAAYAAGMIPILCIGEQKRSIHGDHFPLLKEQMVMGLKDIPVSALKKVVIAYEPVWAIGASASMNPRDMHEMAIFIRKSIVERYGPVGMDMKILYGGSIDDTSARPMLEQGDVNGLLVGRASVEVERLTKLIASIAS